MEHRRQLALQRKADEEKAKALEEERRIKEDGERRKREREEHTDKRPLKGATKKVIVDDFHEQASYTDCSALRNRRMTTPRSAKSNQRRNRKSRNLLQRSVNLAR